MKHKILFVAENVTLAQVVRLAVLGQALDRSRYEVHFASSSFDPLVFEACDFERHHLSTIEKSAVEKALAAGKRIYEKPMLLDYVEADLDLIERVRPSLIVGDFRLSLAVSAPLAGVAHAALINAYWSPFRKERTFPVPDHPIIRLLGEDLTTQYFPKALPRVFEHFAAPINAVRKRHGLTPIGNLQQVLTFGDYTLYPDVPSLTPTEGAPPHHIYLGPILWSPRVPFDAGLLAASAEKPLVYVTLGSSGKVELLPIVLAALGELSVQVLVATANRITLPRVPPNVTVCPFVPGELVAQHAALVISNGGSTTSYQALSRGTPVLGIASNFDQYLAMQAIEAAGAGLLLKARTLDKAQVIAGVRRVLSDPGYVTRAQALAKDFANYPAGPRFAEFVDGVIARWHPATAAH